jgi:RNA polymerase sigma factor (sigma-70 family)
LSERRGLDILARERGEMGKVSEPVEAVIREQQGLRAIAASFGPSLTRFFRRRVEDPAEVDDLVQEVFLRLARRGGVGDMERVGGYVFETAASVLRDRQRRRRARCAEAHDLFDPERHADADFPPDRVLDGQERLRRASAALLELPERTRHVFVLRRLEGLRYQDVAKRLGLSVSSVEKHMQRAMAHLIRRLGEE